MKLRMDVQDLLDGLNNVTRALAVRPVKQVLEGVLIDADEDCITLTCSNGSMTIESTLTAEVDEVGRVVLPGRLFSELARKLPGQQVSIEAHGTTFATRISCGTVEAKLTGMNPTEFPDMAVIEDGMTIGIPENSLRDMITRTAFAIAVDESKPVLTGCLLEVMPEEARLVALDGYRLAMQKLEQHFDLPDDKPIKMIVPGRVMIELSRILPDEETPCQLLFNRTRMMASFGNVRLSSVLLAGEYIDYRKILPDSFRTVAKARRDEVQTAIELASLMAREGKNNLIRMSFTPGTLSIYSSADMGDISQKTDLDLMGEPLEIAFNAKYVQEVIRYVDEETLCMHLNSNVSPCVFKPETGDKYLYLVLPVRIFQ